MLQWFIGAFDDTADSAALAETPVGNDNEIKPAGTGAKTGAKAFWWLVNITGAQLPALKRICLKLLGSAPAPLPCHQCLGVREGYSASSIKSNKCSKT